MRTLFVCCALFLACGRGGIDTDDVTQPITTTTTTTSSLVGRWGLGRDSIKGLPPRDTSDVPRSPYAELTIAADGTFDLMFGEGCIVQGISGQWAPLPTGPRLVMQPDQWQTWTDGVSESLRPTQLDAQRVGAELRITGVDERGRAIDQRWRALAAQP